MNRKLRCSLLQELIDWHRPRMTALLHAGVDLLAFETLPSDVEGRAVVKLLQEVPSARAWVSFSCKVRETRPLTEMSCSLMQGASKQRSDVSPCSLRKNWNSFVTNFVAVRDRTERTRVAVSYSRRRQAPQRRLHRSSASGSTARRRSM